VASRGSRCERHVVHQRDPLPAGYQRPEPGDANDVAFNDISSALWPPYIAPGGSLVWYTPQPLTGVGFTMTFYSDPEMETTPLASLTVGNGITVDTTNMLILPVLQTAPLLATWPKNGIAYYKLVAVDPSNNVTDVMFGTLTIE
jgi:hypothetical protein